MKQNDDGAFKERFDAPAQGRVGKSATGKAKPNKAPRTNKKQWARASQPAPRRGKRKPHVRKMGAPPPRKAPTGVRPPLPFVFAMQCVALLSAVCVCALVLFMVGTWLKNEGEPALNALLNPTPRPTHTPTVTPTPTPTATRTPHPTLTPTLTPTKIPTCTPTLTAVPTATPTSTATRVIVARTASDSGRATSGSSDPAPLIVVFGVVLVSVGAFIFRALRSEYDEYGEAAEVEPIAEPVAFVEAGPTSELLEAWRVWLCHFVYTWQDLGGRGRDVFAMTTRFENGDRISRKTWDATMMYLQRARVVHIEKTGAEMLCTARQAEVILKNYIPMPFPATDAPGRLVKVAGRKAAQPSAAFAMTTRGQLVFRKEISKEDGYQGGRPEGE